MFFADPSQRLLTSPARRSRSAAGDAGLAGEEQNE
jgi:hypothetical protein